VIHHPIVMGWLKCVRKMKRAHAGKGRHVPKA
jgi:hypothetical protein